MKLFIVIYFLISIILLIGARFWQIKNNIDEETLEFSFDRILLALLIAPLIGFGVLVNHIYGEN